MPTAQAGTISVRVTPASSAAGSTPSEVPRRTASAAAAMAASRNAFTASLPALPAPLGPRCTLSRPSALKTGRAETTSFAAPPTRNTSLPLSAAVRLPDTGASIMRTPRPCAAPAYSRESLGETVDRSIQSAPPAIPASSPSAP